MMLDEGREALTPTPTTLSAALSTVTSAGS